MFCTNAYELKTYGVHTGKATQDQATACKCNHYGFNWVQRDQKDIFHKQQFKI